MKRLMLIAALALPGCHSGAVDDPHNLPQMNVALVVTDQPMRPVWWQQTCYIRSPEVPDSERTAYVDGQGYPTLRHIGESLLSCLSKRAMTAATDPELAPVSLDRLVFDLEGVVPCDSQRDTGGCFRHPYLSVYPEQYPITKGEDSDGWYAIHTSTIGHEYFHSVEPYFHH